MNTNGHRAKNTSGGRRSFGWVVNYQAQARRDDATLGLPTAFPSLGVTARGIYGATAAAPAFGTTGPPCPFRPTLRVTGNLNSKEEKLARVTRSFLGNGRLPPLRKRTPFRCLRFSFCVVQKKTDGGFVSCSSVASHLPARAHHPDRRLGWCDGSVLLPASGRCSSTSVIRASRPTAVVWRPRKKSGVS